MNSLKTYLTLWLSGVIAGVIVMERWRRTGRGLIVSSPGPAAGVETSAPTRPPQGLSSLPSTATFLVAGAKADAQRLGNAVRRLTPWTSTPTADAPTPP